MRRKKQKWDNGSLFKIPLLDDSYVVGLVLEIVPEALNSFVGAFYNCRTSPDMDISIHNLNFFNPDMVLFVTRDLLDMGVWSVIKDNVTNVKARNFLNLAKLESTGFVGVEVIGSGIIIHAFNILNHLISNNFADPGELDSLLYKKDI